jgi:nitrogen fixation NifU-like protein
MYTDIVQEHFEQPRNVGVIASADATAEVTNPACGDVMRLYLRIAENRIVEAKFQTQGCPAAIAAGSITTEMLQGRTLEESLELKRDVVDQALGGLPPQKVHASVLTEDAVRAAIANYRQQHPGA